MCGDNKLRVLHADTGDRGERHLPGADLRDGRVRRHRGGSGRQRAPQHRSRAGSRAWGGAPAAIVARSLGVPVPILKNVLGLDLGSHSLKAVEIQQSLRTLEAVHVRAARAESSASWPSAEAILAAQLSTRTRRHGAARRPLSYAAEFPFGEKRRWAGGPFEVGTPALTGPVLLAWRCVEERTRSRGWRDRPRLERLSSIDGCTGGCDRARRRGRGPWCWRTWRGLELTGPRLPSTSATRRPLLAPLRREAYAATSFGVGGGAYRSHRGTRVVVQEDERDKCEHGIFDPVMGRLHGKRLEVLDHIAPRCALRRRSRPRCPRASKT